MSRLQASRPPPPAISVQRWVVHSYAELRLLRAGLHHALIHAPLSGDRQLGQIPERMTLVASELTTNALAHTSAAAVVELRRTDTTFILDVADNDPAAVPQLVIGRPRGASGLGLRLAQRLAQEIGWYVDGDSKHVWAQFPIPAA